MEAGLQLYHARECGLMRLLAASALNNFSLMAVRAVARHTAEELVALRCQLEVEPNTYWGTTSEAFAEVYRGDDLRTGLNLVHHSEDLDTDEKILRTLVSLFLMTCLKRTSFYPKESLTQSEELYLAGLIYTLLNAAPANTHEVHQLDTPCLDRSEERRVGQEC